MKKPQRTPPTSRLRRAAIALGIVAIAAAVAWPWLRDARRGYSDSRGATIVRYELSSRLLGRRLSEIAVLPRRGEQRSLLILLHGRGSRFGWIAPRLSGPASMLSDALFEALDELGPRAPTVVLLNGGDHSYYHDRHDGAWGRSVLDEAIPDAVRRFGSARVAIGGISMGGYGAIHLAGLAAGRFCAVGAHSPALWRSGGETAPGAFDGAADYEAHDVFAEARRGAYDRIPVWLDVGTNDPFRAADEAFARLLRRRHALIQFHVWPGGHHGSYWHAHMSCYLRFYARALDACVR